MAAKTRHQAQFHRSQIGRAQRHIFNEVFRRLAEAKVELRPEYCIENYVNDPKVTPEQELKTEILVPVE